MKRIDKKNIKNILIIRRNNIGDMICNIPVLRTLRKELPEAHITVLADSTNAGIIKGASFIDKVLVYKKGKGIYKNKYLNYWKIFKQNKTKFDIAIVIKIGFSSTSSLISLISGARIRMGCMPEKWHPLQLCYNLPVKEWKKWVYMHIVDAFLELIKTIGIEHTVKDISIEITSESRNRVNNFFQDNNIQASDNIIIFNISNNRFENTWPIKKFKETANLVSKQYNAIYIITSVPSDKDKALKLSKEINNGFYFVEINRPMDFAALVAEADLLICGEGGAMHIGAGVHTPTISLWGKRRPVKWMPYGEKQFVIKKGEHVNSISAEDILEVIKKNNLLR